MKLRLALLIGLIAIGSFGMGAIWAEKKSWPYQWLHEQDALAALMTRIIEPGPVIESLFSQLELKVTNVANDSLVVSHEVPFASHGGGIYAYDNNVLIMSVRGQFILYQNVSGERIGQRLNIDIDNGFDSFLDFEAKNNSPMGRAVRDFRFFDLIYDRQSSPPALFVSHHQWHEDKECYTLRLSKLELKPDQLLENVSAKTGDWRTIYDTKPCLGMKAKHDPFAGSISGGRIVLETSNSVLMSIGDHQFDGLNSIHIHAQDPSSDFGKIIRVDLGSGTASHVSLGHRNPQGLLVDTEGTIWSTEHGPRGGDELNIIRQDMNYGWPYVTYGAQYGERRWPLSKSQNRHDGYARPVFAWIPSMPASNLIQIKGFLPEWEGDILVSSLGKKALHRIRYRDGRVIFDEAIRIGHRIRDLDQLADGTIIMWTDDASLIELRPIE
jgi:hypothetical protein